jgi:diguanylate cyclase (GGDEF)-like protein
MLDIDFFKKINDTYGHDCGDKVLICISDTINKTIQESDIAFRYGGEEFVICAPNSKLSDTISLMERINLNISISFPSCIDKAVTVSSGIV